MCNVSYFHIFLFNDTATTEIYTLSLHDALPISRRRRLNARPAHGRLQVAARGQKMAEQVEDRKSTRLNSSHANISYAVFCLKKKKKQSYETSVSYHSADIRNVQRQ